MTDTVLTPVPTDPPAPPPGPPPAPQPSVQAPPPSPTPPTPGRGWAVWTYLLAEMMSVFPPLILMFTVGKRSDYLRFHTRQAMNLQLTSLLVGVATTVLGSFVPAAKPLGMLSVVFFIGSMVAAVQAFKGRQAPSPVAIRFLR